MLFRNRRRRSSAPGSGSIRDRIDLLQHLAARESCRSYLEIGCNRNKVFKAIPLAEKVGIDPKRGGTHRMTSDEYFRQNERTFDLVFIDGLHHAGQVLRDVDNSLAVLNDGGVVVLHDCNPASEEAQRIPPVRPNTPWNGDVWKALVVLRGRRDLDVAVGDFDHGCGVLLRRPNRRPLHIDRSLETLAYGDLEAHREQWLRLMTGADLLEFIDATRPDGATAD